MTFKKEFNGFLGSFRKLRIDTLFVVFFDLLFYAFMTFIPLFVTRFIMGHPVLKEEGILNAGVESLTADQIMRITPLVKSFLFYSVTSSILTIAVLFFVYTITRCFIWCIVEKKKFNLDYFKRSSLLNLAWIPLIFIISMIVLLILSLFMLLVKSTKVIVFIYLASLIALFVILMMLNLHFLVYHNFARSNKIFLSIGKAFSVLFKKSNKFIIPSAFMAVVLFLLLIPFGIIAAKNPFATDKYSIIQALVVVIYIAWIRFYVVDLVKKEVLRNSKGIPGTSSLKSKISKKEV